jgi:hypothetical protein
MAIMAYLDKVRSRLLASANSTAHKNDQWPANEVKKGTESPATVSLPGYPDQRLNGRLRARAIGQMLQSSNCLRRVGVFQAPASLRLTGTVCPTLRANVNLSIRAKIPAVPSNRLANL